MLNGEKENGSKRQQRLKLKADQVPFDQTVRAISQPEGARVLTFMKW